MHLVDIFPSPIVYGHRGASKYAPENTIAAFDIALKQGAKAFELDTMLTRDNVPVVIHDHDLERTTNGKGEVGDCTLEEIRNLDAGSYFSREFRGERIPTLKEVLSRYKKEILVNIELKNFHSPSDHLTRIVLEMVESMGLIDNIIFSSFLPKNLRILKSINPQAKTALLCLPGIRGILFRSEIFRRISPDFIHPFHGDASRSFIKREQQKKRRVNVWTVDDEMIGKQMVKNGVDGIITNDPIKMLQIIQSHIKNR